MTHNEKLEDIMRDMKKHTSSALRVAIKDHPQESRREWMIWMMEKAGKKNSQNSGFQLWQQDNHPIELYNASILHQKLNYIHNNPVAAGIVERAEEYVYSSAKIYCGEPGLIDVVLVESQVL